MAYKVPQLLIPPTLDGGEDSEEAREYERQLREQRGLATPAPTGGLPPNPLFQTPAPTPAPTPMLRLPEPEAAPPLDVPPAKPGAIDRSSRAAFVRSMRPYAKEAETRTGIPADLMLAINLNEQGWQHEPPGHAYFGIKGANPRTGATTGAVSTWEDYGQGRVNIQDSFRAYASPAESYEDFGNFLRDNPRYAEALDILKRTGDGAAFIKAVHKAGYATDPAWSDKILAIARGLPKDDGAPVPPPQRAPHTTLAEELTAGQREGLVPSPVRGNTAAWASPAERIVGMGEAVAGIPDDLLRAGRNLLSAPGRSLQASGESFGAAGDAAGRLFDPNTTVGDRLGAVGAAGLGVFGGLLQPINPEHYIGRDAANALVMTPLAPLAVPHTAPRLAKAAANVLPVVTNLETRGMAAAGRMAGAVDPATGMRFASAGEGRINPFATGDDASRIVAGDSVTHPTLNGGQPMEVVKASDPALVTVRLATGKEVQVGRKAVTKADGTGAGAPTEPSGEPTPPTDAPAPRGADAPPPTGGSLSDQQRFALEHLAEDPRLSVGQPVLTAALERMGLIERDANSRLYNITDAGREALRNSKASVQPRPPTETPAAPATAARVTEPTPAPVETPAAPVTTADDVVPPAGADSDIIPPVAPPLPPTGAGAIDDMVGIQKGHARTIEANQGDEAVIEEIKADLQKMTYAPRRNTEDLFNRGKARADADPEGEYVRLMDANASHNEDDVATGLVLERRLLSEGKKEQATALINRMADTALAAGRLVQAYTLWNRMTPEGMYQSVKRAFDILSKKAADKGAGSARRFKSNLEDVAEKAAKSRTGKKIVETKARVKQIADDLVDTIDEGLSAAKGTETVASRKGRALLKKVVYFLENEARAPFAPNSPEANALTRMKRLAQETGWNLDHTIAKSLYDEIEAIKKLPKAEREPAMKELIGRFTDDYLPLLEERSTAFRSSQDLIKRTRELVSYTTDRGRLPRAMAPLGSEERRILNEVKRLADRLGFRLPDEQAKLLNDALERVQGLDVGDPARVSEAKRIIREDIGQRVLGPLREMDATRAAADTKIQQAGKTVTFLADQGRNPGNLNLTDDETRALQAMRRNANRIGYILSPERTTELADWLDAIKQYRAGSQEQLDATREYIRRLTTGDVAKEIAEGLDAFKQAKKAERQELYRQRGGFYSDAARAKWEEENLRYLMDEAERITQPRLVFAQKEAMAAARKAVREGSGTELPPEFADLIVDRANALGDMVDGSTEQFRATQEFMNLTRMIVPPSEWQPLFDTLNTVPRIAKTMWDFSAGGIQGGFLMARNPREWVKAWKPALEAFRDAAFAAEVNAQLRTRPGAARADKASLYMADAGEGAALNAQEEQILGNISGGVRWKVPAVGGRTATVPREVQIIGGGPATGPKRWLSASSYGDAFVTFMNKFRADVFDKFADQLEAAGKATDENLRDLAGLVNAGTGRGGHGRIDQYAGLSSKLFFAPSYAASLVEAPVQGARAVGSLIPGVRQAMGGKAYSPEVAKVVASSWAAFLALGAVQILMAKMAGGWGVEAEQDPRSNNFGDIQIGPVRYNVYGGQGRLASVLTQLAPRMDVKLGPLEFGTGRTKSSAGNFSPVDRGEVVGRYARGKLAPAASGATSLGLEEDFIGRDVYGKATKDSLLGSIQELTGVPVRDALGQAGGRVDMAVSQYVPMTVDYFLRSSALLGLGGGALGTIPHALGRSINAYETVGDAQDRVARQMFGTDFNAKDAQGVPVLSDVQKQAVRESEDVRENRESRPDRPDSRAATALAAKAGQTRLTAQLDLDRRLETGAVASKDWRRLRHDVNKEYAGAIKNSGVKDLPPRDIDPSNRAEQLAAVYYNIPMKVDPETQEEDFGTFFKMRDRLMKSLAPEDKAILERYIDQHDTAKEREYRRDMEKIRQYWDYIDTLKAEPKVAAALKDADAKLREAQLEGGNRRKEAAARAIMSVVNRVIEPKKDRWRRQHLAEDALLKKWGYTSVLITERKN